ncbi:MAG: PTS sugar transporter subunit IIA [Kiritimatiellae bacterium]|nr:PTS sugar transporter subunit IIA [Kiritimatiellia bacterium]
MKKLINDLIQLQELFEARAQQEMLAGRERLSELDAAIERMLAGIPAEYAHRFRRLQQRSPPAIVPMVNNVCGGCGMVIPISEVHAIHAATALHTCPTCARLLYNLDSSAPRRLPDKRAGAAGVRVGIARYTSPELMMPELTASDRDSAIREICLQLERQGFVTSGESLAEAALRREAIACTAMEHGIAFPHARGVEGGGLTVAVALSRRGLRFEPSQRTLTRIIFFVVIPSAASAFYLRLLAGLTRTFQEAEAREKLLDAATPEKMYRALCQLTRKTVL